MQERRVEILQNMPLFGGIRDDTLRFILGVAPPVLVRAGEFFFREGEWGDSLFVLEDGCAEVVKGGPGGERVLHQVRPGDCFGEMSVIDLSPRSASVRAVEDCRAIQISTECLHAVYQRDVEQFALIEMNMGREVSRRLRESDAALAAVRSSSERPR